MFNFKKSSSNTSPSNLEQIFAQMRSRGYTIQPYEDRYIAEDENWRFILQPKDSLLLFMLFKPFTEKIIERINDDPVALLKEINDTNALHDIVTVSYWEDDLVFKSHLRLDQTPPPFETFEYQFALESSRMLEALEG